MGDGAELPSTIRRVDVLGVGVSAVNMDSALDEIRRWIETGAQHYVCVTGVHGVIEAQSDAELLTIHNQSGLTVPDGMPMVWAGRWAGLRDIGRVAGPDLMPALCELAAEQGWTSYFYGGKDGVPELLADRLTERFPGLKVVGTYSPPFRALSDTEMQSAIEKINEVDPDLLWIGLSTPKQERFMASVVGQVHARALLGVGAAYDFHAGLTRRAPRWMQRAGLEWLHRLGSEPRRLARRYLSIIPRFLVALVRQPPRPFLNPSRSP